MAKTPTVLEMLRFGQRRITNAARGVFADRGLKFPLNEDFHVSQFFLIHIARKADVMVALQLCLMLEAEAGRSPCEKAVRLRFDLQNRHALFKELWFLGHAIERAHQCFCDCHHTPGFNPIGHQADRPTTRAAKNQGRVRRSAR